MPMPIFLRKEWKAPLREAEDMAAHPPFRMEPMIKPYRLSPKKIHGNSRRLDLDSARVVATSASQVPASINPVTPKIGLSRSNI